MGFRRAERSGVMVARRRHHYPGLFSENLHPSIRNATAPVHGLNTVNRASRYRRTLSFAGILFAQSSHRPTVICARPPGDVVGWMGSPLFIVARCVIGFSRQYSHKPFCAATTPRSKGTSTSLGESRCKEQEPRSTLRGPGLVLPVPTSSGYCPECDVQS